MASQLEIPVQEVQRRLGADNPWWRAGAGIDPEEAAWPRRAYFPHFCRLALEVGVRRAVVLIGPRRVGKTVMLKHLVQRRSRASRSRSSGPMPSSGSSRNCVV